jgi:hypothetical protein
MPLRMGYGRVSRVLRGDGLGTADFGKLGGGGTHHGAKEDRMKELRATVSDEEFAELEHLAQVLGVPLEELRRRSVAAYLMQVKAERAVESLGFGMWADRPEMQDAAKWVTDLREWAWRR